MEVESVNPLISVLIAVKNGEKFIKQTVESILCQSYSNIELIVVVNCSSDNTLAILRKFVDKRLRIFETNLGQLSFNLNYALNLAKGEYIARIDADDLADKDRFKYQIEAINANAFDVVGSNLEYIDINDNHIRFAMYPETNNSIRNKIKYKTVLAHPSILMKKSVILNVSGYLGGRYAQDYDLWLRLMRDKNISFYNIQKPLTKYRIHSEQSKGNPHSFAEVAGYFLKETIYSKKPIYLISSFIYFLKSLLK